jgi:catechol 2,3-dioxygenase-like lactoylglutathione lyase family enzyme
MPHQLNRLTPNLVVSDVERAVAFYRDRLGFEVETTIPETEPYVFAIIRSGPVQIFLNAPEPAIAEYPVMKGRPLGGTFTMFIEVTGIERTYDELKAQIPVVAPLETKWYGVAEFVVADPDGYLITFAERKVQ